MFIEECLKTELVTITELNNKVFPLDAYEGISYPYLTYQASGGENLRTLEGNYNNTYNSRLDIDLYCDTYPNLKSLTNTVMAKLKGMWNKTIGTIYIQAIRVNEPIELYEHEIDCYRSSIEIEIFYNK